MPRARANGIEIEWDSFGDPSRPTFVLVMGFSRQLVHWDLRFVESIVARGFRVVRFDNRDVGLSTHLDALGAPDIAGLMGGAVGAAPYALDDMADDVAGLVDALGVPEVHVAGASMGGMIAQLFALRHPKKVKSLASIMSTTGDRTVGHPRPEMLPILLAPPPSDRAGFIEDGVRRWRALSSPGFAFDEDDVRAKVAMGYDRAYDPVGVARQLAAILTARDRTPELAKLRVPAVVLHGSADPLIDASGGEATARAIPGARKVMIEGMAHDLPRGAWPAIVDALVENAQRA